MIRVLLVDDQELVRSGFRTILESEEGIAVVGEASNGADAVALATTARPDVICMDIEMPELNGIEASRQILHGKDTTADGVPAILILTTFGHEEYLFDALAAGVSGFLLKTARAEELLEAIRSLAAGYALLGSDVTRAVIEQVRRNAPSETQIEPRQTLDTVGLTDRERDVLRLVARGDSNSEIAKQLFLGEATVKTHVSNMLQKLGVRDRIHAVVWAHTNGAV